LINDPGWFLGLTIPGLDEICHADDAHNHE